MPYFTEKEKFDDPFLDKRVKLLPCQKEMIFYWSERGMGKLKISKMFGVSKRLVQFVLDPEKKEEELKRRAERGGTKIYYDKEKHKSSMNKHRARKHAILKDTII